MNLDPYIRYQKHLQLSHMFPVIDGCCACGCGTKLTGRKTRWAQSDHANNVLADYRILKGDTSEIRDELFKYEEGYCQTCGVYDDLWQADHILPVYKGGGACGMENYQTLCVPCHIEKTKLDMNYKLTL